MEPEPLRLSGNTIYHFGVLGLVLAACSWRTRPSSWRPLVLTCVAVVALTLGREFGLPGLTGVVGFVPVIRNLGGQYLWVGIAVPLTLLVAIGVENLRSGAAARVPGTIVIAAGIGGGLTLAVTYGLREPGIRGKVIALTAALVLAAIAAAVVW